MAEFYIIILFKLLIIISARLVTLQHTRLHRQQEVPTFLQICVHPRCLGLLGQIIFFVVVSFVVTILRVQQFILMQVAFIHFSACCCQELMLVVVLRGLVLNPFAPLFVILAQVLGDDFRHPSFRHFTCLELILYNI